MMPWVREWRRRDNTRGLHVYVIAKALHYHYDNGCFPSNLNALTDDASPEMRECQQALRYVTDGQTCFVKHTYPWHDSMKTWRTVMTGRGIEYDMVIEVPEPGGPAVTNIDFHIVAPHD